MTLSLSPGCHPAHLPLSSLSQGLLLRVLQPFHIQVSFHMCHLTASYFHLRLMSTSQTRDPGERVSSWAHPPRVVISRLAASWSGSHAEPSAVWVQQVAGREQGSVCASPSQAPCPGGITGTAALFRAKNLPFSTVSPDVGPTRKEGLRLTMGTSRDARLFHLAPSKRGLRCPAFKQQHDKNKAALCQNERAFTKQNLKDTTCSVLFQRQTLAPVLKITRNWYCLKARNILTRSFVIKQVACQFILI